jgi:hypothetical protein
MPVKMHFRIRKNVVQLVRNTYDPESKRAVAKVVGRLLLDAPKLTDELRSALTDQEVQETLEWIDSHHRTRVLRSELAALELPDAMQMAAHWFEKERGSASAKNAAQAVVAAWQQLRRVLRDHSLIE